MHIAGYIVFIFSVIAVSAVTPLIFTKKKTSWWDYTFPFIGAPLWFILKTMEVGGKTSELNAIIELFIILLISLTVPWLRYVITFMNSKLMPILSFCLTFSPIVVTLLVRLTMPLLPE